MGCWFTKKDPSQPLSELNDIHLQITNKSKDGPISSENHINKSHGNRFFSLFFSCTFISNK
jgi:hypothetical protein